MQVCHVGVADLLRAELGHRGLQRPLGRLLPGLLGLTVAGGAGGAAYLGLALALRLPELNGVLARFGRGGK